MHWETIHKDTAPVVLPRLTDYDRARSDFTRSHARAALVGLPDGGIDMAHEAVDGHVASDLAEKVALRCVARDDSVSAVTYAELARPTARFANVSCARSGSATGTGCSPCSAAAPSCTPRNGCRHCRPRRAAHRAG